MITLIVIDSDLEYLYTQMQANKEDKDDEDREYAATALGAEESRQMCICQCNLLCVYLCWSQLLRNP